jgi:hypothetical protein
MDLRDDSCKAMGRPFRPWGWERPCLTQACAALRPGLLWGGPLALGLGVGCFTQVCAALRFGLLWGSPLGLKVFVRCVLGVRYERLGFVISGSGFGGSAADQCDVGGSDEQVFHSANLCFQDRFLATVSEQNSFWSKRVSWT